MLRYSDTSHPAASPAAARATPAVLAIAATGGVLCASYTAAAPGTFLCLAAVSLAAGALAVATRRTRAGVACAVGAVALVAGYAASLDLDRPPDSIETAVKSASEGGTLLDFEGRVVEQPVAEGEGEVLLRYVIEVRRAGADADRLKAAFGRVLLYTPAELAQGAAVSGTAAFYPLPGASNPGQFDYGRYLARRGVTAIARAPYEGLLRSEEPPGRLAVSRLIQAVRASLERRLEALDLAQTGVIPAVLIGERSGLSSSAREAFARSGTMHLLAISGLHLAVVVGFVWWILRLAGASLRASSLVAIAAAVAYALVAGGRPPVIRAALMSVFVCGAILTGRRGRVLSALSTAALVMLVWRPLDLFDAGFQMSFAAVLALYSLGAPLARGLAGAAAGAKWRGASLARAVLTALGWSIGAWLGVAPLAAWHFHIVTPVSPLANLILIPVTSVMVVAGFAATAVSFLSVKLASLVALSASGAEMTLEAAAGFLARLPAAYVYVGAFDAAWAVAAYAFLAIAGIIAASGRRVVPLVILALGAANVLLWPTALGGSAREPRLQTLVDRSGAAAVLFDGEGNVTVFVGSKTGEGFAEYVICPFLIREGAAKVDLIVETAGADARVSQAVSARLPLGRIIRQQRFAGSRASTDREALELVGPGDAAQVFCTTRMVFHSALPKDFRDPARPYFEGLVTEVELEETRLLVAADVTAGCLEAVSDRVGVGADVLCVLSPASDAPAESLAARLHAKTTAEADPDDAGALPVRVALTPNGPASAAEPKHQ